MGEERGPAASREKILLLGLSDGCWRVAEQAPALPALSPKAAPVHPWCSQTADALSSAGELSPL